jgi:hypothetical protein
MIGPQISQGLNQRGTSVAQDLNPEPKAEVGVAQLQEVDVDAADPGTTLFTLEGKVFHPDETAADLDESSDNTKQQHVVTGTEPAADPPKLVSPSSNTSERDDEGPENPQHSVSGLNPSADPPRLFRDDEKPSQGDDEGLVEAPVTTPTGLDPALDPDRVFRPDESVSERDESDAVGKPQHEVAGVDPAVDPDELFRPDESTSEEDD